MIYSSYLRPEKSKRKITPSSRLCTILKCFSFYDFIGSSKEAKKD